MKTSAEINELAAALMLVQNQVGNLPKTAKGYGYDYTPLDAVTDALREPLAENGLSYVQMPSNIEGFLGIALTTCLMHVSGQWIKDTMIMPIPELAKGNEAQAYGAGLTYARRYALTAMFGIAADEDTDATTRPGPKDSGAKKAPSSKAADLTPPMPTDAMMKKFNATGRTLYGDAWDDKRPELVKAMTAKREDGPVTSSKSLYRAEMQHLIDGMETKIKERKEA